MCVNEASGDIVLSFITTCDANSKWERFCERESDSFAFETVYRNWPDVSPLADVLIVPELGDVDRKLGARVGAVLGQLFDD